MVDYAQTVGVLLISHKIDCISMVLTILNTKGHQNPIIGLKDQFY